MIDTIKLLLKQIINDIDAGNSNLTEEEAVGVIEYIKTMTDKTEYLSKEESAKYLRISVQYFDLLRRKGEIPNGIKRPGVTNLLWSKKSLDEYIEKNKDKDKSKNKYCTRTK